MSIRWAKIHTKPSVVGIVIAANATGTAMPPTVPNMNAITSSAIGIAIDSPRPRSSLKIFCVSWLMAG